MPVEATNRVGSSQEAWRCGGSFLLANDGTLVAQANEAGEEGVVSADRAALTPRGTARAQPRTDSGVLVRVWRGDAPAAQMRQREEVQEVVVVDARGAAGAGGVTSSPGATSPIAWPIGGPTP